MRRVPGASGLTPASKTQAVWGEKVGIEGYPLGSKGEREGLLGRRSFRGKGKGRSRALRREADDYYRREFLPQRPTFHQALPTGILAHYSRPRSPIHHTRPAPLIFVLLPVIGAHDIAPL